MWIVLVIFSCLVFFDTVAYGQTGGCSIKLDQAPSLRGIKLGMSLNQVLDLIPGSREDRMVTNLLEAARRGHPDASYQKISFSFSAYTYQSLPMFNNLQHITVRTLDDRVTDISVSYASPSWDRVDDFVAKVAESLNLPGVKEWEGLDKRSKNLKCQDFEVHVFADDTNPDSSITLSDLTAERKIAERKKAVIEKARKEFKP
jgi:hypothetical protein